MELCAAILIANARSNAQLMLLQLEDLQLISSPVNIPGTHNEYPNWRRKQTQSSAALLSQPAVQAVLAEINTERSNA